MTVPEYASDSPSCRNPIGIGKSTAHDAHDGDDDELQGFSKGVAAPYFEMIDALMSREYGERKADKGRRRCEVRPPLLFSKYIPCYSHSDTVHDPVWGLSSWYFERASIIRWQGIRAGAPPMLLLARNRRAAERDTPSPKPARDYRTPKRSIIPISPEVVAINCLDKPQRSIGPLPIMGRTLPITMEERDRRSG
jgi:hypothetical protein